LQQILKASLRHMVPAFLGLPRCRGQPGTAGYSFLPVAHGPSWSSAGTLSLLRAPNFGVRASLLAPAEGPLASADKGAIAISPATGSRGDVCHTSRP
jgi:hypothetical protein